MCHLSWDDIGGADDADTTDPPAANPAGGAEDGGGAAEVAPCFLLNSRCCSARVLIVLIISASSALILPCSLCSCPTESVSAVLLLLPADFHAADLSPHEALKCRGCPGSSSRRSRGHGGVKLSTNWYLRTQ